MKDRATQALYLLALDPVAETTADGSSYPSAATARVGRAGASQSLLSRGVPMFSVDIPRLKVFDRAVEMGTTVNNLALSSKDQPRAQTAWTAYQTVAQEILNHAR